MVGGTYGEFKPGRETSAKGWEAAAQRRRREFIGKRTEIAAGCEASGIPPWPFAFWQIGLQLGRIPGRGWKGVGGIWLVFSFFLFARDSDQLGTFGACKD